MLFDTDILIWVQRGSTKAARLIEATPRRCISAQTYMELMQSAKSAKQQQLAKSFLMDLQFETIPLSSSIGHRACVYIDQFSLSHGLRAADAIIAATAVESNLTLASSNQKHYKFIPDLCFKPFKL